MDQEAPWKNRLYVVVPDAVISRGYTKKKKKKKRFGNNKLYALYIVRRACGMGATVTVAHG